MPVIDLLHVTDPHLFADESRRLYGVVTAESLQRVLDAALAERRPDAVLVTGDIGDDFSAGAYDHFRRRLGAIGVPVYCLPGNHDDPASMSLRLNAAGFQFCGRARLGDWGLVLLDTHLPGSPSGRLADAELVRLEADVRACGDAPVLVALHHPPVPVGSAWLDACGLENGAAALAALDRLPAVRAVVAGHVHQEFELLRNGVRILTTPSTCAQFTPGTTRCVMDRRPPGWRWLRLHADGRVDTQVHWLPELVAEPVQEDEERRGTAPGPSGP